MKKAVSGLLRMGIILAVAPASSLGTKLLEMRNRIFEEAKEIKALAPRSSDAIMLTSIYDTCLLAVTQFDAYFAMLVIFNTIPDEAVQVETVEYLITWLNGMKTSNDLNIRTLDAVTLQSDPGVQERAKKLSAYFAELNKRINTELVRIFAFKALLKNR